MARSRRGSSRRRSQASDDPAASGGGGFVGQIGLFETANGLPHGPAAIALAIGAALVIYPVMRVIRMVRGR
jgi:hypothetical protein